MRIVSSSLKLIPLCLGVAAMFVGPYALSQTSGAGKVQVPLPRLQLGLPEPGCPVLMTASQRSFPQQIKTGSTLPAEPAQGLTVTMTGLGGLRIMSAEVVAHALSPRSRPVLSSNLEDADVTRSFHLKAKDGRDFSRNLWMEGVTSIRWIEVKSLTYSDGSAWHESETERCIVRPNPLLLISSTR